MKSLLVLTAMLLAAGPAISQPAPTSRYHQRSARNGRARRPRHSRRHARASDGSQREGPLQVNPEGTVGPAGLHPRIVPLPEVIKSPRPRR
jgi:hypothetical protein